MSVSSEALLISSVIRDSDVKVAIKNNVNSDMFHAYRDEWQWIERYYQRFRKTPTKVAFKAQFPEFRLKAANDTGHFAEEVRKSHARHELTATMNDVAEFIKDGDIDTAIKKMSSSIISIAANMGVSDDGDILRSYEDVMSDITARRERYQELGSAGVPTGFITLDERTGGPQPGELWVIGARLGEGKSWTMQRMAASAVMNGYKVQFDALEQSRSQVAMRIYSMLSGSIGRALFDATALMQGKDYDPMVFRKFVRSLKDEVKGALHVSDASRGKVSTLTIASQIERNKPDIVFVDYITLLQKTSPDWQGVAQVSSDLLAVANEYGVPIVAASQLNREFGLSRKGEPPGPEALAQSDAIGQDATAIITMSKMSDSVLTMKMAKNRNGVGGFKWYTHFAPNVGKFEEVTYNKALDIKDSDQEARDAASDGKEIK